ncbi:hypothetical protein B9479_000650 [Cryptococcus floricola]|uniref:RING-type domain-containing protein n=1 Tax=Cryptococcus floricola TaxID=2591691 RepID=A0A5D3B6L0_9TREE|nr:hypothetical protein B9479_000650 [Cryptococcus floricola]
MSHEVVYDYVEHVDPNLVCAICQSALVDPVTTGSCKHTFCRDCITRAISHNPQCPIDRSALSLSGLRDTEQLVKLMLDELKVRCGADGCGMVLQRGLFLAHLRSCPQAIVTCRDDDCGLSMTRHRMPHHRAYDCFQRRMECKKCGTILVFKDQTAHANEECCDQSSDSCDLCGETLGADSHMHKWRCTKVQAPCPHAHRGCSSIIPRADIEAHLTTCPFEAFSEFFDVNETRFKSLEVKVESLQSELESVRSHLRRVEGNVDVVSRVRNTSGGGLPWPAPQVDPIVPVPGRQSTTAPDSGSPRPEALPLPPSPTPVTPTLTNPTPGPATPTPARNPQRLSFGSSLPTTRPDMTHQRSLVAPSFGSHQSYADWAFNRLGGSDTGVGSWDDVLNALRGVVVQLAAGLDSMERRNEVRTMTESLRMLEEVGSLRAIVTTMRMQVMMDRPSRPGSLQYQTDSPYRASQNLPRTTPRPSLSLSTRDHDSVSIPRSSSPISPTRTTHSVSVTADRDDDAEETASITESVVFSAQGHPPPSPSAESSTSSLVTATNPSIPKRGSLSRAHRTSSLGQGPSRVAVAVSRNSGSTVGMSGAGLTGRPVAFPPAADDAVAGPSGSGSGAASGEGAATIGRSQGRLSMRSAGNTVGSIGRFMRRNTERERDRPGPRG